MKTSGIVSLGLLALRASLATACGDHGQDDGKVWSKEELDELESKWGFEVSLTLRITSQSTVTEVVCLLASHLTLIQPCSGGGCDIPSQHADPVTRTRADFAGQLQWAFTGIGSFAHLKHVKCLTDPTELFDIGIIGVPFDTAVSYRPGARFGPRAIRHASSRQTSFRGFNPRANINPYQNWASILDCGDVPVTPMDNVIAVQQMTEAFRELGRRKPLSSTAERPKLITLGGDHSLALPALRALKEIYERPIRVLHFDAHLDTWHPTKYPSAWTPTPFNHGSMFWLAHNEGLLPNTTTSPSVHAGLRTRLSGTDWSDHEDDTAQNWIRFAADDMDDLGTRGIIDAIMSTLGTEDPVYLSVDIDVLDPAFAPGTGTPEPGGWTTRELIRVLRGVEGLNVVGADVVEVSPAYQGAGEETALAGAQVVYEILSSMVKKGLEGMGKEGQTTRDEL